jgi:hypothetical protein
MGALELRTDDAERADPGGYFELRRRRPGRHKVEVTDQGGARVTKDIDVRPGQVQQVDFVLPP